jgi:indolepyruvate ferredoxin oxidoreductase beta subunit
MSRLRAAVIGRLATVYERAGAARRRWIRIGHRLLLIPAVGGQGGGVLSEWIVDAALGTACACTAPRFRAWRSGPARRRTTSSCTRRPERRRRRSGLLALSGPGALDVLVAPEFLEVGRMIELGFVSPLRTTVVASTHPPLLDSREDRDRARDLSAGGSAAGGRGRRAAAGGVRRPHAGARARHRDQRDLAGRTRRQRVLPIPDAAFRSAIERKGVAVKSNLSGFELGLALVRTRTLGARRARPRRASGRERWRVEPLASLPADLRPLVETLPLPVRALAAHGVTKLIDYQDAAYARRYLELLRPSSRSPPAARPRWRPPGCRAVPGAVDELRGRGARGRSEDARGAVRAHSRLGAGGDGAVVVTDYLKPDLDEIWGVLPDRLVRPIARWAERRWPHGRPTVGQHVRTTTISGFLRVWLLARLKRLRPISYRAREEHARIARWLDAVQTCAGADPSVAAEVAQAAQLVKGYGDVRRRMFAVHEQIVAGVLRAVTLEAPRREGFTVSRALAARLRALVLQGPDGEGRVPATIAATLARLETGDVPARWSRSPSASARCPARVPDARACAGFRMYSTVATSGARRATSRIR